MKIYSITQARNHFNELLETVEQEGVIQLTQRNKVIAFLLSPNEYDRISQNTQTGFWNAYLAFRQRLEQTGIVLETDEIFANVRDRSVSREANW